MGRQIDFDGELNADQLAAATHGEEPQLILAGAGSGKTRAITYRIAWLVQERGIAPETIAALTFTNKAAAEMRDRVELLLGLHPLPAFVGTFHRFALRLLRTYGARVELGRDFAILDSADQLSLIKKALKLAGVSEENLKPQAVLGGISSAKNRLLGPAEYERKADDFWSRQVAKVYHHYQNLVREAGGVDFDDMIRLSHDLLANNDGICRRVRERTQWLLVDEFQDTNFAQLALIRQLMGDSGRITAVGDEDQGIYRWRGAELENILRFERYFPGAVIRKLERNYRSTQNILDAAGAVVARNEKRRGKNLWTDAGLGDQLVLYRARDEQEEARWIVQTMVANERDFKWRDMAILVRTNAQTRPLEEELLRRGLAYSLIAGTRFYERAEIKDVMAYLRLLRRPDDPLSFGRVLNVPTRGIGKTTQEALERLAESSRRSAWEVLGDDRMLEFAFSSRALTALKGFRLLIETLRSEAERSPLPTLLRLVLDASGYLKALDPKVEEDQARRENLAELVNAAQQFTEENTYGNSEDLLTAFLDHVALVSDTDSLGGKGIALMTLHAAKGLEFEAVAIGGLEEGVLPHFNAKNDEDGVEEERRLLYVGMTRAKHRLFLSTCRRRRVAGTFQDQTESRFVDELPVQFVRMEGSPELFASTRAQPAWAFPERGPAAGPAAHNVFSFFGKDVPSELPGAGLPFAPENDLAGPAEPTGRRGRQEAGSLGAIRNGTRVRHAKLGLGKVLGIEGSGDNAKLDVFFEGVGRRKLVAKFANLEVL